MCPFSFLGFFVKDFLCQLYCFLSFTAECLRERLPQILIGIISVPFGSDERLLNCYFAKVHFWFPFLDSTLCRQAFMTISPSFTSKYCMFMLIMALGSLAEQDQIRDGQQWAEYWAQ